MSVLYADMKTINRNCFERCITNPSGKLENAEQVRIYRLYLLIIDVFVSLYGSVYGDVEYRYNSSYEESNLTLVSRAYVARVTKESSSTDITTGGVSY